MKDVTFYVFGLFLHQGEKITIFIATNENRVNMHFFLFSFSSILFYKEVNDTHNSRWLVSGKFFHIRAVSRDYDFFHHVVSTGAID